MMFQNNYEPLPVITENPTINRTENPNFLLSRKNKEPFGELLSEINFKVPANLHNVKSSKVQNSAQ